MVEFLSFLFYITTVFFLPNEWWVVACLYTTMLLYCFVRKVKIKEVLYKAINIIPFILMAFVFNVWLDDLRSAIFVAVKLLTVFLMTIAYAQTLSVLTFAKIIEKFLSPMSALVNIKEASLVVCLALSMVPNLRREMTEVKYAIRAKGMELNLRNAYYVVLCLFGRLINRVDELDMALKSKGIF